MNFQIEGPAFKDASEREKALYLELQSCRQTAAQTTATNESLRERLAQANKSIRRLTESLDEMRKQVKA